ncbi:tail fiber domain-containing protein [Candidatus Pacearchaeota archaeon]|nr:tail fiber domain-containing protein [Candidatus Pacearchaeota archaeon]
MKRGLKYLLLVLSLVLAINLISASLNVALSDQGSNVKTKSTGALVASGDLEVTIYDDPAAGNLIYNETFTNAISNGTWNIMLGEGTVLPLEFGKTYWRDYKIKGEDVDFTLYNLTVVERRIFYSPLGDISGEDINQSANLIVRGINATSLEVNGGWESNGVSIRNGNIFAQTGYFYNITGLNVSILNVNGSILPNVFDDTFDIGNSSLRWRDLWLSRNLNVSGTATIGIIKAYDWSNISHSLLYNHTLSTFNAFNSTWDNRYLIADVSTALSNNITSVNITRNIQNLINDTMLRLSSLNVTGDSYLGRIIISADNISSNNFLSANSTSTFSGNMTFRNYSDEFMRITGEGKIGIGTTSPTHLLNVFGNSNLSGNVYLGNSSFLVNQTGIGIVTLNKNISFFNSSLSEVMRIQDNGKVGIGTASPLGLLHVKSSGIPNVTIEGATSDADAALGSQKPQFRISGGNTNNFLEFGMDNSGATAIGFIQSWNIVSPTAGYLSLNPAGGNVGIGTTSPGHKLTIVGGNINISGNAASGITFEESDGTGYWNIAVDANRFSIRRNNAGAGVYPINIFDDESVSFKNRLFVNASSGNVGIGRIDAEALFNILNATADADAALGSKKGQFVIMGGNNNNWMEFGVDNSGANIVSFIQSWYSVTPSVQYLSLNPSGGNVGIGTTSPGSRLEVENTASADDVLLLEDSSGLCEAQPTTTGLTWSCSSDERLKTNIKPSTKPLLDYVMGIPLFDYTVIKTGENVTGPIAQRLNGEYSNLVNMGDDGYYQASEFSSWTLVKAIQEQQIQIEKLKTGNQLMKEDLCSMGIQRWC